jgi:glutathione S-transferase
LNQEESFLMAEDLRAPLALKGAPGSPYTRKMLALLRYRRIPYRLLIGNSAAAEGLPEPKVALLPTFYFPDASGELEAVVDSTPIIRRLEDEYVGRSVIPADPVLRFLDCLIEDYGDEWLTKAMFHYRWHYEADIERAGQILPRWRNLTATEEEIAPMSRLIAERQISRLYVVGSNDITAPVIEDSYKRFLDLFRAHLVNGGYTLGNRPCAADFALYGQLTQLTAFDPTPMAEALARAPQVYAWVSVVDDLSGLDPGESEGVDDWFDRDRLPDTLTGLLGEIGRTYVPALLANAAAVDTGAAQVETEIDGKPWVQQPFPYQARCLQWLRGAYVALDGDDRQRVDQLLEGTGCGALFVKP